MILPAGNTKVSPAFTVLGTVIGPWYKRFPVRESSNRAKWVTVPHGNVAEVKATEVELEVCPLAGGSQEGTCTRA